jgi:4-hydroxythreonine-4-phosphate dehydrogenase
MKPLLITSGEPAGIGPDVCLDLADTDIPLVVLADKAMLVDRARLLGKKIDFRAYSHEEGVIARPNQLTVMDLSCSSPVIPGKLDSSNAQYVVNMLGLAADLCLAGEFSAIVTAPVHKSIINDAGVPFTGHTEFFQEKCKAPVVVMMLACEQMKVALMTTHLPLRQVADSITSARINEVVTCLHNALQQDFLIKSPIIWVAGLNPHAGEAGKLGTEESHIIAPALRKLKSQGINVHGPFAADTLFTPDNCLSCDVFVAMYHDQGLPVLKYAGFGNAVNVTLGLPIIRTSVDHGTALELAGKGLAKSTSIHLAVNMAAHIAGLRNSRDDH